MELIEMIGWIVLGFVPTFGMLDVFGTKIGRVRGKSVFRTHIRPGEVILGI